MLFMWIITSIIDCFELAGTYTAVARSKECELLTAMLKSMRNNCAGLFPVNLCWGRASDSWTYYMTIVNKCHISKMGFDFSKKKDYNFNWWSSPSAWRFVRKRPNPRALYWNTAGSSSFFSYPFLSVLAPIFSSWRLVYGSATRSIHGDRGHSVMI